MGGAGGEFSCPADPGITMCGSETCGAVDPTLAMGCYQTCCTTDMKCGTTNPLLMTPCNVVTENTSMCPNEMIQGMMVPGCCVDEATNECGIMNTLGIGEPCVGRTSQVLQFIAPGLAPKNCDGTPVMEGDGGAGMGGAGGGDPADAGL
jgi:hypothetical protein